MILSPSFDLGKTQLPKINYSKSVVLFCHFIGFNLLAWLTLIFSLKLFILTAPPSFNLLFTNYQTMASCVVMFLFFKQQFSSKLREVICV